MKITGIDIGDYRQFKNIKFDFTYPADHPTKAGQPLDKVCFIGQSGTGKTTLLNVIWDFFQVVLDSYQRVSLKNTLVNNESYSTFEETKIYSIYNEKRIILNYTDLKNKFDYTYQDLDGKSRYGQLGYDWLNGLGIYDSLKNQEQAKKLCLFIKDSIAREADAFLFDQKEQPQSFSDFVKTDTQIEKEKIAHVERINAAGSKKVVSLGDMQSLSTWQYLLREINQYDEDTVQQITKIIQSTPKNKVTEDLQKWIAADPRIDLAEKCLNPLLKKFFLEVNIGAKGNSPIALCKSNKQDIAIPSSNLSTGTRQLLATAIPIYKFDTEDTVILFDEPERSLFPDIQRGLIGYYTSLAPTAQFFFATHSPIIASAFEPCERFILYFDENGEVKFHNGIAPEGDDPNDILRQDFAMADLMLQKGLEAYEKYRQLAMQIRAETDEEKKNQLIIERLELGNRYNFAGQYAQSK
ncbi:ATP-binding protein [Spirosoma aureum]|uniref:ATP-binding protein n=1 Tax=Spirosoma aureum TaxID=2692134 RepID=A0A6G9AFX6_9BACT|nr:AAA family ATPase [Spirosoma aureum]QIP11216.1 ATP-binding protein [Spirosoma aureum]